MNNQKTILPDPQKWSSWRKENYIFLKDELSNYSNNVQILDVGVGKDPFRSLTHRFKNLLRMDVAPRDTVDIVHDFNKELPLENNRFDCIILTNTLEHSPNPNYLLKEISRVLKPGGKIIGTVPFLIHIHQEPYDFYRFTRYILKKLFEDNNFTNTKIHEQGNPFHIYRSFQGLFFWHLLNTNFSKNNFLNYLVKLAIRAIWLGQRLILKLATPIYQKCKQDNLMVQGYGFTAIKLINL